MTRPSATFYLTALTSLLASTICVSSAPLANQTLFSRNTTQSQQIRPRSAIDIRSHESDEHGWITFSSFGILLPEEQHSSSDECNTVECQQRVRGQSAALPAVDVPTLGKRNAGDGTRNMGRRNAEVIFGKKGERPDYRILDDTEAATGDLQPNRHSMFKLSKFFSSIASILTRRDSTTLEPRRRTNKHKSTKDFLSNAVTKATSILLVLSS
jgi:hypothetical protein